MPPEILSSSRKHFWTLKPELSLDYFGFQNRGSLALLLLAMHVSDERPWAAARNPVLFDKSPGSIDLESKRILAKRYRPLELLAGEHEDFERLELDPIPRILERVTFDFENQRSEIVWPSFVKEAGKLLPRKLTAEVFVKAGGEELRLSARNFSETSQCLHAEVVLLFALSAKFSLVNPDKRSLESFTLHSTLKPCKMCAAFLQAIKEQFRSFEVAYDENDPGPLAKDTALDRFGYKALNSRDS